MTGLFGRLRSWVGSLFGSQSDSGTEVGRDESPEPSASATDATTVKAEEVTAAKLEEAIARAEGSAATRAESAPSESRATEPPEPEATEPPEPEATEPPEPEATEPPEPEATEPPTDPADVTAEKLAEAIAQSESTPTTVRHERDDDADTEQSPFQLEGGPKTVRVPASETTDDEAEGEGNDAEAADEETGRSDAAFGYRCTVCGTGVETPDDPCPLCRSSELVPTDDAGDVYDATGDGAQSSESVGQKTASISDADDAVERLRNLRQDEE
jgi:rubrerythrin